MTDNKDLNQRFDKLEARLESLASNPESRFSTLDSHFSAASRSDEIDLRELFSALWQGKWWIIGVTFLFVVAGVFYAMKLPNIYKSEGVYVLAQNDQAGGAGAQFGSLAAMTGIDLGGGNLNEIDQAVSILTSWSFLEAVINKHNLKPLLLGVKGWDSKTDQLVWDRDIYDPDGKVWVRGVPEGDSPVPTSFEAYEAFSDMIRVNLDPKTSFVVISVEHYSPLIAKVWVNLLVEEVNDLFRVRDMAAARENIDYLSEKILQTGITVIQSVLYDMIEVQMKNLMLAEVGGQYLIETVIPAMEPEVKVKPRRALLCIAFAVFGGFVASFVLLVRRFIRGGDVKSNW